MDTMQALIQGEESYIRFMKGKALSNCLPLLLPIVKLDKKKYLMGTKTYHLMTAKNSDGDI